MRNGSKQAAREEVSPFVEVSSVAGHLLTGHSDTAKTTVRDVLLECMMTRFEWISEFSPQ